MVTLDLRMEEFRLNMQGPPWVPALGGRSDWTGANER